MLTIHNPYGLQKHKQQFSSNLFVAKQKLKNYKKYLKSAQANNQGCNNTKIELVNGNKNLIIPKPAVFNNIPANKTEKYQQAPLHEPRATNYEKEQQEA